MGFFDSKSSQRSGQGTAGSQTQSGDPTSVNLTAGDDLQSASVDVTNYVQQTDYGAIELAMEAGNALARGAFGVAEDAVTLGGRAVDRIEQAARESLRTNERVTAESLDFAGDAFYRGLGFGEQALDANEQVTGDALAFAEDSLDQGYSFAADVFGRALETVETSAGDAVAQSNAALREVNRDASERTSQVMLYVAGAVAVAAVLGVMFKR